MNQYFNAIQKVSGTCCAHNFGELPSGKPYVKLSVLWKFYPYRISRDGEPMQLGSAVKRFGRNTFQLFKGVVLFKNYFAKT